MCSASPLARRAGAALVEYLLVLALVVMALIAAADQLGTAQTHPLGGLAHHLGDPADSRPEARPLPAAVPAAEPAVGDTLEGLPAAAVAAPWRSGLTATLFLAVAAAWLATLVARRRQESLDRRTGEGESLAQVQARLFEKRQEILRSLGSDLKSLLDGETRVRQVMTHYAVTVTPDRPLDETQRVFADQQRRHLLVCEADGKLAGIISGIDLRCRRGRRAGDVMTANPVSVDIDSLLGPAITVMLQRRISCLPVVDQGKVVGVLTSTDCMMALQCSLTLLHQLAGQFGHAGALSDLAAPRLPATITQACQFRDPQPP